MKTEDKKKTVRKTANRSAAKPAKKPDTQPSAATVKEPAGSSETSQTSGASSSTQPGKSKKYFRVIFFYEWCKSCGICAAMCPKNIILLDDRGHPLIEDMDECIGCRNCEIHCPDFAITVKKRHPERRRTNGSR